VQDTVDIDLDICGEFISEVVPYNITNNTNKQKNVFHICLEFVYAVDGDETINIIENDMLNNEAVVVDEGKNVCKTKNPKGKITKKSKDVGKKLICFIKCLFLNYFNTITKFFITNLFRLCICC